MYLLYSEAEFIALENQAKARARAYNPAYSHEQVERLAKLANNELETLNLIIDAFKYLACTHPQSEELGNIGLRFMRGWMENEHPCAFFRFKDSGGAFDNFDVQVVLEVNAEDIWSRHKNFSLLDTLEDKNLILKELWSSFEYYLKTREEI